jgi:hypothetical protein
MNYNKIIFGLIALFVVLAVSVTGSLLTAELVSIGLFVYFLLNFIDSIGKSYNMLDIPILLAIFQCLLMPILIYHVYNDDIGIKALKYDMSVRPEVYYGFMLPAVLTFIAGVKLPEFFQTSLPRKYERALDQCRNYLKGKGNLGLLLIIVGVVASIMGVFVPGELKYVVYLFSKLLYVGAIYTYFSDQANRMLYLIGAGVAILAQALGQGMFGELIFLLALAVMLIMIGKKVKASRKFGITFIGIVFVLLIQTVKGDFRTLTWGADESQSKTETFFSLVVERISDPGQFFNWDAAFPMIMRFNQGMIVAKVLDYVPRSAPFAEGETITTSLAASFVPRIMWPDKPTSGGQYNMERFTGYIITGYSMNISPMGEAYGNYGVEGGIVFMFFYGLFFSLAVIMILRVARKRPTIILWFPVLFLNSIQMETDILMCVNSLLKNLFFIWFCYWAADRFLRLKL